MLTEESTPEKAAKQLKALELGRFLNGAIELAADQNKRENIYRLQSLAQPVAAVK